MGVSDYSQIYADAGAQYGVDPALLMAQGSVEDASGDPTAVGPDTKYGNARGVAQFIPETAKSLGVDTSDPKSSIFGQAKLLRQNIDRYGNIPDAVSAYHGGTDKANWGAKTGGYTQKVLGNYKQMTQNTVPDEDDPFEGAKKDIAEAQAKAAAPHPQVDEDDPFEGAKKDIAEAQVKATQNIDGTPKKPPIGAALDVAETIPSSIVKTIGSLPQLPAMAVNAAANSMGYVYGKAAGATPEQQEKLNNLNPLFTGNTPADALIQADKAIINNDPGKANPLTGDVLHDPETRAGRYTNALVQAVGGGAATGIRKLPSLLAGAGAQTGSELLPGNPVAPLIGGAIGGLAAPTIGAINLRTTPEETASNALQNMSDSSGPSGGIAPGNINPTEIIPGSKPTLAQVTNDPNIALVERQLQAKDPAAFKTLEDSNEGARQQFFEKASGTPQDIATMEDQREVQTTPLYEQAKVQQLDPAAIKPVLGEIDTAIEQVGEGSDAGKTLAAIKNKITGALPSEIKDDSGRFTGRQKNPTQSPLIQIYREERDNLQKPATAEGAYAATVKSVIQPIVSKLGQAIESQSPPFAQAQQIYRNMSPKIDAADWMQNLKLTDATGRFTLAKVNNALTNANKLRASNGLNAAKSLAPDQMQALTSLRDDLLRREQVARASMPRGSNTVQNALSSANTNSLLGKGKAFIGNALPEALGSAVGYGIGSASGNPGAGAFAGDLGARYFRGKTTARTTAATNALQNFVLDPESYKQHLLNQSTNTYGNRFNNLLTKP